MKVAPAPSSGSRIAVTGWFEAAGFVLAIGALSLVYAIGHQSGAHPIAFVLYAILGSSILMLALTGPGPDALAIACHPMSWLVGVSIILVEVFYFLTISYVSPAHGNLVLRFAIPIAMLAGWLVFGRRPAPVAAAATAVVTGATLYVVAITDPAVRAPMTATGVCGSVALVVRGFAGEFHPRNRAARTVREKLQITGILLLVTSILCLALASMLAAAIAASAIPRHELVPTVPELFAPPTILLGALAGGGIFALMNALNFSAVVKITTENIMAVMALSPITVWMAQEIGVAFGWILVTRPEPRLVAAMTVIVVSVLVIVAASRRSGVPDPRQPPRRPPAIGPGRGGGRRQSGPPLP